MSKKAILVISYGTSFKDTMEKTINATEKVIAEAFPDRELKTAWTSRAVIKVAEKKMDRRFPFIDEVLESMIKDGFDDVVIQSTHIMNGLEYDFVVDSVKKYRNSFKSVKIGSPLLTTEKDYDEVVDLIKKEFVPLAEDGSLLLMGHGTVHPANATYSELQLKIFDEGLYHTYVTTVEGFPNYESTLKMMRSHSPKKVTLVPFMLVAGDHANNDLAGDGEDSLKNVMKNNGFDVKCIVKGLGEIPSFQKMFVEHAKNAKEF